MTLALDRSDATAFSRDRLSGRAKAIDRWIYVFMAAFLIAIVFTGFIPDSIVKVAAVETGKRPAFPLILHVHAVLMGSFLLLLLAQTVLVATGRRKGHMELGIAGMVIAPAIVISGFILVPTMYHIAWNAALAAPLAAKQPFLDRLHAIENTQLLQIRAGILFTIFMWIALRARTRDAGLHKRMMIIAVTAVLGAAISRIHWPPGGTPNNAALVDVLVCLSLAPMLVWDVMRNRSLHRAYLIWAAFYVPAAIALHSLWDTAWWHTTVRHIMGV